MNPPEHQKEFDSAEVGRKFQVKFADAWSIILMENGPQWTRVLFLT